MKNLLVAQSGGPSAAINATITGVIDAGIESGRVGHVYGALNGIKGAFRIDLATLSRWLCKQYQRTQKSRLLLKSIRISGFVICLRHIQFSFSWSVHL